MTVAWWEVPELSIVTAVAQAPFKDPSRKCSECYRVRNRPSLQ